MINSRALLMLRASSAAFTLAALSGVASAQGAPLAAGTAADAAPAATSGGTPAAPAEAKDIIVTGSRLGRAGYDSPTPVNVVGQQRLEQLAITNVGDALNQIPSFRPISSPSTNSFRVSGSIGARTLDLRGLGATRTLTLVDGRRFVASADNGTVDLNSIPTILVRQTEVVTGGASAAYGANAVAGVVNIILDRKFTGFKAEANVGIAQRGDAFARYGALAWGRDLAGGRGHVIIGGEYSKENGIGACETRPWCSRYTNYLANPGYNTTTRTSTNGLPATLVLDHVMFVYNENGIITGAIKSNGAGGTITLGQQLLNTGATSLPAALRGKQFDTNGNLVPYQFGNLLSGLFAVYPNGDPTQPFLIGQAPSPLVVPTEHANATIHGDYDLTDDISASVEFMFSRVEGHTNSTVPLDSPAAIDINNPYISDATRATILAADPAITKLNVNHGMWSVGGSTVGTSINKTYRGAASLKGDLGHGWNWDASYTYGRVEGRTDSWRTRLKEWNDAVDAVRVTTANVGASGLALGSIVCRTTLANPANGCIPINLFAFGIPAATDARYNVDEWQTRTYQQHAASVNLRGTPLRTWAGEVKFAIGGEWRRDTAEGDADANTLANRFISPTTTALPYTRTDVVEGYIEVGVPLLKDSALGRSLDLDGAIRRTHYDPFGNATTWKMGGVYTPIPDITFRVTRSRDIRAPSAQESSPNATRVQLPQPDPFIGSTTQQFIVTGGNPNLKLERGDTFTAGVVLKPSFLRRFNLSFDYYDIKVKGAIDSLSATAIATACKGQGLLCDLIQFNPNGSINTVFSTFQNLSQLHAEGYELVADYRLPALGGNFDFQLNGNWVLNLNTIGATGLVTKLDNVTGNAGTITNVQGVPRWKADAVITYSRAQWALTAHARYIPRGILDPTKTGPEEKGYNVNDPNSVNINHVDSAFYLDLTARVKFGTDNRYEAFVNVNNVFDRQEPDQLRLFGNGLYFDPYGRYFRVGLRVKM
ncbi:TonB-dependent receptor [Sphingomonas sp.]|uniref:TonB-dependent receptor domain-containing protein n=1 Tax=Sphingomonas sp. TaxID=28214 RepID=UPI000DB145B4|nr:TonB-dependent receptor [Sphingomonas sp.]PZU08022.1 MAG: TonB-dependent receptor [Sphingomonas sp.]